MDRRTFGVVAVGAIAAALAPQAHDSMRQLAGEVVAECHKEGYTAFSRRLGPGQRLNGWTEDIYRQSAPHEVREWTVELRERVAPRDLRTQLVDTWQVRYSDGVVEG